MDRKIVIIGAGVSGLIAACELEQRGFSPLIIEASSQVGGRVKTTVKNGFCLDHGFQVLLTAYPEARHYLDFKALDLKYFEPGAVIFLEGKQYVISDPSRDWQTLLPMLLSPVGTLGDKLKMLALSRRLKRSTVNDIFDQPSRPTMEELKALGFSERIITNFFQPFFAGIFLEADLSTSSRMFNFVFKMFSEGMAAIPAAGIQAIPDQLAAKLTKTTFDFNTKVLEVESGRIVTEKGDVDYDQLILASYPGDLLPGLMNHPGSFNESYCFYFTTDASGIGKAKIGLVPGQNIVNNFHFPTDLHPGYAPQGKTLVSATVVGQRQDAIEDLREKVREELEGLTSRTYSFLHAFHIERALPVIDDLQYSMPPSATRIQDNIFLAGDHNLNPSLNAAMLSGRLAAIAAAER